MDWEDLQVAFQENYRDENGDFQRTPRKADLQLWALTGDEDTAPLVVDLVEPGPEVAE